MSKMSNIDLSIKYIKKWLKDHVEIIIGIAIVIIISVLIHSQEGIDEKEIQEKENRINTIEERLTKQENYMHQVEADIDNLYRWVK